MRIIKFLFLGICTFPIGAENYSLAGVEKEYSVPEDEEWLIHSYKLGNCKRGCTSDITIEEGSVKIGSSWPSASLIYAKKNHKPMVRLNLISSANDQYTFSPGTKFLLGNNIIKLEIEKKKLDIPELGITGPAPD